jgi:hypothetical protein
MEDNEEELGLSEDAMRILLAALAIGKIEEILEVLVKPSTRQ